MNETQTQSSSTTTPAARTGGSSALQLGIIVAILAGGIALTALTSDVMRGSEPGVKLVGEQPFLPDKAGSWTGGELTGLTPEERAILPSDTEGARRIYRDTAGHELFCSVVLAGRDVTSIHRPELCLRGQGWTLEKPEIEQVTTPAVAGGSVKVSRINASREFKSPDGRSGQARTVFVYWFIGKDRTTPYHWQRILWTTEDRVLHNRNHRWAYFLLNAPVQTSTADSMQVITRFVQDIYPDLVMN